MPCSRVGLMFLRVPAMLAGMATDYDRARTELWRRLGALEWNAADLARESKLDEGTVLDFLNGVRTPQNRTRAKIEKAVGWAEGTLGEIARGLAMPSVVPVAQDEPHVADVGPDPQPAGITDDELLAIIQRQRAELDEVERRLRERGSVG